MAFPLENLLTPNITNILISLVIPFLLIFTVLLFTISRTKVFGSGKFVYILIALGLTVLIYGVNPGGVFQLLSSYLLQLGIMGSAFALVMIFFIFFWAIIKTGTKIASSMQNDTQKLRELEKQELKLQKKYYSTGAFGIGGTSAQERMSISKQLESLEREKRFLLAKMKRLQ